MSYIEGYQHYHVCTYDKANKKFEEVLKLCNKFKDSEKVKYIKLDSMRLFSKSLFEEYYYKDSFKYLS